MTRALVLNAGLSWAAYQVGALSHLVGEQKMTFELCAGSGIGAMNAALTACGAFDALAAFWDKIGPARLLAPNPKSFWMGLASGAPQRRFLAAHVSEERLRARGAKLVLNVLSLRSGRERIFEYPGSDLPIIDALMAAVATPGLCPPVPWGGDQLAEGTFVNGFLLEAIAERYPEHDLYAVAPSLPNQADHAQRYTNWRATLQRAIEMNQSHDVREGIEASARSRAAALAFSRVQTLPDRLCSRVADPALAERLRARLQTIFERSSFPLRGPLSARATVIITPSKQLEYPLWSFRRRDLARARALGHADAQQAIERQHA